MAEEENIDQIRDEEDYYTFLNVARDATQDQIHQAYRRLSRLYHPDKHVDPARKKEAEMLFNKTKRAYEVLSDGMQRAVYDNLGVKGLEEMKAGNGWEVMQRTMTPQEIREEYERLARENEERRLNRLTKPKGTVIVRIDATNLFSSYSNDYGLDDMGSSNFPYIEVSGMTFYQSIEAPLTSRDTATMSGQLTTKNGTGTGSVCVSLQRLLPREAQIELSLDVGNGPVYSVKGYHPLTRFIFCEGATSFQVSHRGIDCGFFSGIGVRLDDDLVGYLRYTSNAEYSAMSTALEYKTRKTQISFTIQLGVPNSYLAVAYARRFLDDSLKLSISAKYGTLGATFKYGADKVVSKYSTIGASVSVGIPSGVMLNVKLIRANQIYLFPINICEDIVPAPVFYATLIPLVAWVVVKKLVVDPIKRETEERDKEKQRKMKKTQMEQKQREAQAAVNLMSAQFERVRAEEEARRGLVIVQALYGKLVSSGTATGSTENCDQSEMIDVVVPLQCLVKDSKLMLHEASKCHLPGFYDPCVGEDKQLTVQYLFHNQMHEITVADNESLRIPKTSHRINPT